MTRFTGGALILPERAEDLALEGLANFRFRRLGEEVLLTGDAGEWALVPAADFEALAAGKLAPDAPALALLREKGLLEASRTDEERAVLLARRKEFAIVGPYLHVLVVTLRCNQACVYCHASRVSMESAAHDMSLETAERSVETALQSPAQSVTFEFQGGEPLANWPVVRHVVERAKALGRAAGKTVLLSLVSNLSLMDDEKLEFLVEHGVQVCTSLDGPQDLHDANRPFGGASSHAETVRWMERINAAYQARGLDPDLYHVEALLTVTQRSLSRARDIVDEYAKRGLKALFARPLDPFGFAQRTVGKMGYSTDEFLRFYGDLLDRVLELNRGGTQLIERLAAIFLSKILTGGDPNYLDIRSPCGAGIGQLAYDHDGRVFCCDEGRMLHQMGDSLFQIGQLGRDGYGDLVESEVVRSVCLASCLEGLPGCSDCAYLPYCGTCPVYNYATQGNIFGRMPENEKCRLHRGILDRLFGLLGSSDPQLDAILARWVEPRNRPYFAHEP
jgi:uncharacterized protein